MRAARAAALLSSGGLRPAGGAPAAGIRHLSTAGQPAQWNYPPKATAGQPAQRSYFPKAKDIELPPIKDDAVITFGKHNGKTFAQVAIEEPNYCQWVRKTAFEGGKNIPALLQFALYLERRTASQPGAGAPSTQAASNPPSEPEKRQPEPAKTFPVSTSSSSSSEAAGGSGGAATAANAAKGAKVLFDAKGPEGCLKDMHFVLTGRDPEVPRTDVERCIEFFGGEVRNAVSGKTSYLLTLGSRLEHWSTTEDAGSVEKSRKFYDATNKKIPRLEGISALTDLIASSQKKGAVKHFRATE